MAQTRVEWGAPTDQPGLSIACTRRASDDGRDSMQVLKYFDSIKLSRPIISYFWPVVDLECHMLRFSVRTRGVVHLRQIADRGAELAVLHG